MDLRKLQKIEKAILEKVVEICNYLNIQYFLVSGSMLGAVRYEGFIPWDDDIDIAMFRPDYDRFLQCAQDLLPEYYFLQTHYTDPEYFCSFAKIRDCRTTFVEKSMMHKRINHGVYIDIFPLDGFPMKSYERAIFLINNKIYNLRLSRDNYSPKRSLKWRLGAFVASILCPSLEKAWQKRDALYRSIPVETAEMISNLGNAWGKKEIMERSVFRTGIVKSFEGLEVTIPIDYDIYLTKLYGDYMTPPSEENRIPHHYCLLCDLENSYQSNLLRIQELVIKEMQL